MTIANLVVKLDFVAIEFGLRDQLVGKKSLGLFIIEFGEFESGFRVGQFSVYVR